MRVALEISGMQRYGAFFPDMLKTLNGVFGPVDLFVHHWTGPYTAEQIQEKAGINPIRAIQIDSPRSAEELHVNPAWQTHPDQTPIYNVVSMCVSVTVAAMLRAEYEHNSAPYDLAIRARSDIRLVNFPTDPTWALDVPPGTVRVGARPSYLAGYPIGIQDQFAIGRGADMYRYAHLWRNIDGFHDELPGRHYHPETYVGWSVRESGLQVDESGFSVQLERAHLHPKMRATY